MFLVDHDQAGAQQWCEDGRAGANDDRRCAAACQLPGIETLAVAEAGVQYRQWHRKALPETVD